MNLQKLVKDSSKLEEIEFLDKVASLIEEGSYLSSLFSKDLLDWTRGNIRNDFPSDLYDYYSEQQKSTQDALSMLERVEASHKKEIAGLNQGLIDKSYEIRLLNERLEARAKDYNASFESYESTLNEVRVARNKEADKAERLEAEVSRLKIEVYDLTHSK